MTKTHGVMKDLLLNSLLESSSDGILAIAADGTLLARSPRLESLLGIPAQDPFSLTEFESALQTLLPSDGWEDCSLSAQLRQTQSSSQTLTLKNGRSLEIYSQPIGSFLEPQGRVWCFRNLVQNSVFQMQTKGSAGGSPSELPRLQILTQLTHDLRSPLCTLQMATQVLKQCIEESSATLSEGKRRHAEVAIQLTRGAVNQINSLLTHRQASAPSTDTAHRQNSHLA